MNTLNDLPSGEPVRLDHPVELDLSGMELSASGLPGVLVHPQVLSQLYAHAQAELHHEVGGYLVGIPYIDPKSGVRATYVHEAVRATYISTPTHITMLPTSLLTMEKVRLEHNMLMVGYYHSHPGLSVFQSGEDVSNFSMYYSEPYQVAIVVDPTLTKHGDLPIAGQWIGYFVWDKPGKPARLPISHLALAPSVPRPIPWSVALPKFTKPAVQPEPATVLTPEPVASTDPAMETTVPIPAKKPETPGPVIRYRRPDPEEAPANPTLWIALSFLFYLYLLYQISKAFMSSKGG